MLNSVAIVRIAKSKYWTGRSSRMTRIKTFRVLKFVLIAFSLVGLPRYPALAELLFGNVVFGFPTVVATIADVCRISRTERPGVDATNAL